MKQSIECTKWVAFFGDSLVTEGFSDKGFVSLLREDESIMSMTVFKNFGANGHGIEKIHQRFIQFSQRNDCVVHDPFEAHKLDTNSRPAVNQSLSRNKKNNFQCHHIVIFAGINDAWKYRPDVTLNSKAASLEIFERTLSTMLNQALTHDCHVTYVVPHFIAIKSAQSGFLFDVRLQDYINAAKNITENLSNEHALFHCIDLREVLKAEFKELDKAALLYTRDGVHLNTLGQKRLADSLLPILKLS